MCDTKYDKAMAILQHEYDMELECAMRIENLIHKTLNPFKRIKLKRHYQMLMDHAIGIRFAQSAIRRNLESN